LEEATSLFVICEKLIGYHLIQSPTLAHILLWGENKIENMSGGKNKRQGDGGQEKARRLVRG